VRNTFLTYILNETNSRICAYRNCFANNLDSNCPPCHILFNYQRKDLQPTNTTIFNKPLPCNIEVNNVSNFIAYYVGHHRLEDVYNLWNYLQIKKLFGPRISR
jgi:hypothetical protein